jgi:hypothetical protein
MMRERATDMGFAGRRSLLGLAMMAGTLAVAGAPRVAVSDDRSPDPPRPRTKVHKNERANARRRKQMEKIAVRREARQ